MAPVGPQSQDIQKDVYENSRKYWRECQTNNRESLEFKPLKYSKQMFRVTSVRAKHVRCPTKINVRKLNMADSKFGDGEG